MRIIKNSILIITVFSIFLIIGCNKGIKKFHLAKTGNYISYYNKDIKPLKKEWAELYFYLKQGHIQKLNNELNYTYSYDFYQFLKNNLLRIYETPYLQDYDQFIKVFGKPPKEFKIGDKVNISYFQSVVGNACTTCQHNSFGYVFDATTKKLLKK